MPIALKTVQVAAASTISCAPFAPLTMDAQTPGPALIVVAVFAIKLHVLASPPNDSSAAKVLLGRSMQFNMHGF